ncbi:MAG: ribonuclease P protein component [Dehalococcoidales bacterium]|nr:ribonuclease P protein component [Dehalococcoidales bacterium]
MGAVGGQGHLTKPKQYELVYSKGGSWVCRLVVMRALPNALAFPRYGFSVGKRVGKAVVRNKVKRRLREIVRIMPLKPGWDIVFIARPAAAAGDFTDLKSSVKDLLSRAHLLGTNETGCCSVAIKAERGKE